MKIALLTMLLWALPVEAPLPPDLIHVDRPSCTLLQHTVGETYDVKTQKVEQIYRWRVEPYATYDDHREQWELPKETLTSTHEERKGAIADTETGPEALQVCQDWMNKVKAAVLEARRKQPRGKKP